MITSNQNSKIKWVRSLQGDASIRRQEGVFIIEGVRLAEEALAAGWVVRLVLHTADLPQRAQAVVDSMNTQGALIEEVSDQVMRHASDTQSPQGVLVALETRSLPIPGDPSLILIADGIRDPGNLGSMLRTAAAVGVDAALVPPGGVDVYAPKVVRAAMGGHFRLPLEIWEWEQISVFVKRLGLRVLLADAGDGEVYSRCDLRPPLALVVGGEAAGSGQAALQIADQRLHIPMAGNVESLNAAAATAVLLFEVRRQRETSSASRT